MEYPHLNLPTVKPKWRRKIQTSDIQASDGQFSKHICTTCNKNEARYSCPKCRAPYCSVACYKVHDIPPSKNRKDGGGRCTEQFYRQKVKEVTDLHVKDDKNISQMRDILTRTFYKNDDNEDGDSDDGRNGLMPIDLSDEEVMDLIKCGLNLEDINENADEDVDIHSVPDRILRKFEMAVQRGELSHVVQQWNPISNNSSNDEYSDVPTLDERILKIPSLVAGGDSRNPKVHLEYNICEVLFVIVWTFRMYDCFEAVLHLSSQVPENAAEMALYLQGKSQVLANDARYDSLKHVLMDGCQRIRQGVIEQRGVMSKAELDKMNWRILTNDLLRICRCRRSTLKVLICAYDTVDRAIIDLNKHHGKYSKNSRKKLFLVKKKLEYFLSWCQSYWDSCSEEVTKCIEEWIDDWNPREGEALSNQDEMLLLEKAIRLKNTNENLKGKGIPLSMPEMQKLSEPLLIPVKTKKL